MKTKLLFLHALSPLHPGTGQSMGPIDLSIARTRPTNHPYLPGSSLKGRLRAEATSMPSEDWSHKDTLQIFGPESGNEDMRAGSLAIGDAQLLLLPIRALKGTFGWVTSPLILARYQRDAQAAGIQTPSLIPSPSHLDQCIVTNDSFHTFAVLDKKTKEPKVLLEDLDFKPTGKKGFQPSLEWAEHFASILFSGSDATITEFWSDFLIKHFCIVHDDAMAFLSRHGTEVVTRNVLDPESKVTENLWTEENLPAETILFSLLTASGKKKDASGPCFEKLAKLCQVPLQFGGHTTTGKGLCKIILKGGAA
jgi:CRISPR-associated protein Cmr4